MKLDLSARAGAPLAIAAIAAIALTGPTAARAAQAKVALVTRDFNNPYWSALRDGAVDEGKKLGIDVNAQAGANETDADGENAKISTLANQNSPASPPRRSTRRTSSRRSSRSRARARRSSTSTRGSTPAPSLPPVSRSRRSSAPITHMRAK